MVLQPIHIKEWIEQIAPKRHVETLNERGEVDFSYTLPDVARFRVNAFYQRELAGMVLRVIPCEILPLSKLSLPKAIGKFVGLRHGLVLVTGATGSGKSTTLAAIIDAINDSRPSHILTIEDPIEFVHKDKRAVVNQREVGQDTGSFSRALRAALRQDPDVILIGEMRDPETIETALHASETGHLVLSTLHTTDAADTVNRIIGMFPPHQQSQTRKSLSGALQGVVSQRLLPKKDGKGRIAACEIMVATELIRDCIRDPQRTSELREFIAKGQSTHGSQTFDQALVAHYRAGQITEETVFEYATNPSDVKLLLSGIC
jgi:twitching motility protein PilT